MGDDHADVDSLPVRRDRGLRIGFLAQENLPVPPHVPGASVARVVYELARELAPAASVAVCSLEHPDVPEGTFEGVRYLRVPPDLDRRRHDAYGQLVRVLRRADLPHRELQGVPFYARHYATAGLGRLAEHEPDVVHLQNLSHLVPLARRLLPGSRVVLHVHCDWLRELPPRVVRRRLEHVDLVLGVSDYISGRIRERFPELAARCLTLHNGVRVDAFRPRRSLDAAELSRLELLRNRLRLGPGPIVLYVGTLAPEKGNDVLLRAFSLVRERVPDASLLLVGRHNRYFQVSAPRGRGRRREARLRQRDYPREIAALVRELGERVVLVDGVRHEELAAYYALADVFVMPSTGHEPFPLPVLEALASELPVVATRRGGLPEIVRDGVDGALVRAGDPAALAAALAALCADPAARRELGARGRTLVEREFTWAYHARRLLTLYEAIAAPAADSLRSAAAPALT